MPPRPEAGGPSFAEAWGSPEREAGLRGERKASLAGVAALIPALNEEDSLPGVLSALRRLGLSRMVVVDNGSVDGTARVARAGGAEVVLEPRRGYGSACLAGIRHLQAMHPPETLVFLDGDQSDDPEALRSLVEPIGTGAADLVIGVRRGKGGGEGSAVPLHARLGNRLVLAGMRRLHGALAHDLGPFRAVRFDSLLSLAMDDPDWGWTLQMQIRAHHAGLRVLEVPVSHRPRAAGRSKVSGSLSGSVRAGVKMIRTLFSERRRLRLIGPA